MKNEELGFGRFDDGNQESDEFLDSGVGCVVLVIGHEEMKNEEMKNEEMKNEE